jgi:hypothetical protein
MSKQRLPWYKRNPADWRRGTRMSVMSLELRGFYSEVLDTQWELQRQLPKDRRALSLAFGCSPQTVAKLMPKLIALGKVIETSTGYYNPRMMADILGVQNVEPDGEFAPANLAQTSDKPPTNLGQTSDKPPTNLGQTSGKPQANLEESLKFTPKNSMISTRDLEEEGEEEGEKEKEKERERTTSQSLKGRAGEFSELKAAFNGSAAIMLADVARAMRVDVDDPCVAGWLQNSLSTYGQTAVAEAYQMLLTKRGTGAVVVSPIAWWSKTASTLAAKSRTISTKGGPDEVILSDPLRRTRKQIMDAKNEFARSFNVQN